MNIFFDDGSRIYLNGGYGNLSRSLVQSLAMVEGVNLYINKEIPTDPGIDVSHILALENVHFFTNQPIDFVFRVAPPSRTRLKNKKVMLYTQNALGGLRPDWKEIIEEVDGVIVPGEFDRSIFRKINPFTYTCPQTIDNTTYSTYPAFRKEGPEDFGFLFVGSFSYRKGVDLLLHGFNEHFSKTREKATLHMISPTGLNQSEYNMNLLIRMAREAPKNLTITCNTKMLSPEWMRRMYNRYDAAITMTRGEGWCMPLHEALLCEKPVIAPDSTAMKEFLPSEGVIKVPVATKPVADITDDFGISFKNTYGASGITTYEPSIPELSRALSDMMNRHQFESYKEGAKIARKKILNEYNIERNSIRLGIILRAWLNSI